ncbi:MAG TPA: alpha/beta hydrolase family protein [Planctomycetaceae bacterium]|nr:alpha/beta hydrolase family protein [Planctomycetaceae bacterium]
MRCEKTMAVRLAGFLIAVALPDSTFGQTNPADEFLQFVRGEAVRLREHDSPPKSAEEWQQRKVVIREKLAESLGLPTTEKCLLEPRVLGTLERDGYRLEKLVFQTMPGVWMTALAYVPKQPGPRPAILQVHGHWKGAKQDPVVQSRCIGAAKLGFFVLAVDAFGAGERAIGKALGEYHGEMSGATLFPSGMTLAGVQLYENMRAVDYLQTRPEVDPTKIGVTGASGGGNQSMYAGAYDERIAATVPVCSVGNYLAYLGAACCMCEVVPGALRFAEERDILGLTAPRGLLVVNNSRDANQFSIREARKSLVGAQSVYDVLGKPDGLYHATFRWHHDYHQPVREAMYGFMTQHLKGEGDGSPIAEIPFQTEDPETIRCFPGESRPDDWMTLPQFAASRSREILTKWTAPTDRAAWEQRAKELSTNLRDKVFGGFPQGFDAAAVAARITPSDTGAVTIPPETNVNIRMSRETATPPSENTAILLNLDGADVAKKSPLAAELRKQGWNVVTVDLRATGIYAVKGDSIGRAPDHNSAEWSLWIGRPLLGQWTYDVLCLLDVLKNEKPVIIGEGPAGLVALSVGVLAGDRVRGVAAVNTLASYVTDVPYQGQRLGIIAPGILRHVGDVPHLAAISSAPWTVIAGGVTGDGKPSSLEELQARYAVATKRWDHVRMIDAADAAGVIKSLKD